jgi:hypothetical protein
LTEEYLSVFYSIKNFWLCKYVINISLFVHIVTQISLFSSSYLTKFAKPYFLLPAFSCHRKTNILSFELLKLQSSTIYTMILSFDYLSLEEKYMMVFSPDFNCWHVNFLHNIWLFVLFKILILIYKIILPPFFFIIVIDFLDYIWSFILFKIFGQTCNIICCVYNQL